MCRVSTRFLFEVPVYGRVAPFANGDVVFSQTANLPSKTPSAPNTLFSHIKNMYGIFVAFHKCEYREWQPRSCRTQAHGCTQTEEEYANNTFPWYPEKPLQIIYCTGSHFAKAKTDDSLSEECIPFRPVGNV